jgi:hypothetical protein
MFLYETEMHQSPIKYARGDLCGPFLQFLQGNPVVLQIIWFTHETQFHFHGYINKQYIQIWAKENLNIFRLAEMQSMVNHFSHRNCLSNFPHL